MKINYFNLNEKDLLHLHGNYGSYYKNNINI